MSPKAKLFDETFIDSLPAMDKYANARVVAMCRRREPSLIAFRERFEDWFRRLPMAARRELAGPLRSTDDGEYLSAFYEVILHEYARQKRWRPRRHARIQGKTPDLLLRTRSDYQFFLEVTVPHALTGDESGLAPFYAVLRALDDIETAFVLSVHLRDWSSIPVNTERLKARVAAELAALPRREGVPHRLKVTDGGMTLVLSAHFYGDRAPTKRSVGGWIPPVGPVRRQQQWDFWGLELRDTWTSVETWQDALLVGRRESRVEASSAS